ncbi:hypothetical protein [Polaribacter aquimarinus]|uniref:Lipoprotein n=1 Tax=Polaribacter aquimarinus TaxID=2100726 RepID=A0A2U2JEZ2_9FLAO|nr:hypothetical protein [Polaribacter aquimarinus]PWG06909.1 hypothetical protein DIS07_03460 [Polaribacter aquimarinus]
MKKTTFIFLTFLIFYSCQKEESKSDFIGNWSATSDTNFDINITFSNDSILIENPVVYYDRNYSTRWKVIGKKIELEEAVWNYKFNLKKDSLLIKHQTDSVYDLSLKRIKNNYEFLENKLGFELRLPKTNEELIKVENKELFYNIYIGKENKSIIIRTDNNLKSINQIINKRSFLKISKTESNNKKLEKGFKIDTLTIALLSDKSINNNELDSIKSILKDYQIKRFFRIYNNEEYTKKDWKAEINWLGKYEN